MLDSERTGVRRKQIEFPPEQSPHRLVTPVAWGLAILFTLIVIIVVSTDANGPFLGPW